MIGLIVPGTAPAVRRVLLDASGHVLSETSKATKVRLVRLDADGEPDLDCGAVELADADVTIRPLPDPCHARLVPGSRWGTLTLTVQPWPWVPDLERIARRR